jgi:hypothetical protein
MVIGELLATLLVPDYSLDEALGGHDYPFAYVSGHPSFPTDAMPVSGPYRLVIAKDRIQYTGKGRTKVIFQLPYELLQRINGRQGRLNVRLTDGHDQVDVDFLPTGLTKERDMRRLIRQVDRRFAVWRKARAEPKASVPPSV